MHLYDSNPGFMKKSLGGVGRNIAENLARLHIPTTLITPLGHDGYVHMILDQAQKIGLKILPIEINETPLYVSIINELGEDMIGVALMDEIASVKHEDIMKYQKILDVAELIVLDTNLSNDFR